MKKIFIYILLSLHVFFTGNIGVVLDDYFSTASAASTTWNLSTPGDYILSSSTESEISGGVGMLKKRFEHIGFKKDNTDLNSVFDVVVDGNYAYITSNAGGTDRVSIVDISTPSAPNIVSTILHGVGGALLDGAGSIEKIGNYLYIASQISDAIQVIDVTNPLSPVVGNQVKNVPTSRRLDGPRGLVVHGNYLYVAAQSGRAIVTIDVTNPANPVYLDTDRHSTNLRGTRDLIVSGNHIIATSYGRDRITSLDITNPANPVFDGSITNPLLDGAWHIVASGNYAYVSANRNLSVQVIDISDPSNLSLVASIPNGGSFLLNQPRGSEIIGDTLFVTSNTSDAINAIDISNPLVPVFVESITDSSGGDQELNGARGITSVGDRLFITAGVDDALEILDFDYSSTSPTIIPTIAYNYTGDALGSFSEVLGAGNAGDISYQISKDNGSSWYYWSGSSWQTTVSGVIESNGTAIINTNITSFDALGGGTNEFLWKAFLNSDGTQKVELDEVILTTISSAPILSITKVDNDADNTVTTDQIVRYTITLANDGLDSTGISITDTIDTDFGSPYNFTYSNCGSVSQSFSAPTLTFSSISVTGGSSCIISYDLQVDSGALGGDTITNSADASVAIEGGNDPAIVTADTLTILACGVNDVNLVFETDDYGEDTFWSLVPNGNACGVGEISNGGNPGLTCASGGAQGAGAGDPYADSSIITEGPFSLTVGAQYDLHVIDDYGDGITVGAGATDPDIRVQQNGGDTNTFSVTGNGGVFTFTVQEPTGCADIIKPNVTINQAPSQLDPTTVDSAIFRVIFDEPINTGTFTSGDIALTGTTGTVTSGPTEISPNNGTSFEITVTGMTLSDTVIATIASGVIEDTSGNTNNASTSSDNSVTYIGGDSTPPVISSTNFASGSLLPGGNHTIVINYSDADSGIDTSSASLSLYKWDGVSAYGPDISGTGITLGSITTGTGTYSTNNLGFGKYRYIFSISDIAGNPSTQTLDFYIDIPEFTISTPEIDLGILNIGSETFSPTVTITVKTIGAGFNVTMNRSSSFIDGSEAIQSWDTISGYGYDQSPFSSSISTINADESIASQGASLNTNGDKNTYTFDIQIGSLIDMQQASGDYEGSLDFGINLTY